MGVENIVLLGDERLYQVSQALEKADRSLILETVDILHDALMDFRRIYGVGRAIAAPQVAVFKRLIYMHIDQPEIIINPTITSIGNEKIEVWDDCMSFPNLLVKVKRYKNIRLDYFDIDFNKKQMILTDDLSELLQHEYDHLNGILATQQAINDRSFRWRKQLMH